MSNSTRPTSTESSDRDTSHWVAGVFYANPENPRLLVPKRLGGGWTFNFARPIAWLLAAGLFAIIGLTIAVALLLPHVLHSGQGLNINLRDLYI
jgi:uncharacterized membrane protein